MTILFCSICNNLCEKLIESGTICFKCLNCGNVLSGASLDTEKVDVTCLYKFNKRITESQNNNISNATLKQLADDPSTSTIDIPCMKCGKKYLKRIIKKDYTEVFDICSCNF